jgi:hypothetical protein
MCASSQSFGTLPRTKRSCETQLILSLEDILKATTKGKQIDIALLDFSKAFDKVPHQRLNNKLNFVGIRDNTLNWISSFLHNRTQLVLLDNIKSSTTSVDSGVSQKIS